MNSLRVMWDITKDICVSLLAIVNGKEKIQKEKQKIEDRLFIEELSRDEIFYIME